MAKNHRKELHKKLVDVMDGRGNVYFQPPASIKLEYPCLIYSLNGMPKKHADNVPYFSKNRYDAIVIDRDPDSEIAEDIIKSISFSSFDRRYVADNLYHDSITIYW